MREFKFRAWSNKYNHMFRVKEISQDRDGYTHGLVDEEYENEFEPEYDSKFAWVGRVDFTKSPNGECSGLFQNPADEPFILMQFTGLKERDGKEIYEGDVVEFEDFDSLRTGGHTEDNILQGEVSFSCGAWIAETERGHYDLYTAIVNDEELEIIGNVFEGGEINV